MYDNRVGGNPRQGPSQSSYGRGTSQSPGLGAMSGPPLSAGRAGNISYLGEQTISGNYGPRVPVGSSNQAPSQYSGGPNLASRVVVPPPGAGPAPHVAPVAHQSIPRGMSGNFGSRVPVGSNQGLAPSSKSLQPPPGSVQSPYSRSEGRGW